MVLVKCIKNVSITVHLSYQFYLLYKQLRTNLKFLVPILEPLTTKKCTVKGSFNFANEIIEQDPSNFIGSLEIDSFFYQHSR